MNREIKFRGRRVDNGKWSYGNFHYDLEGSYFISTVVNTCHFDEGPQQHIEWVEVDPETVCQFAGLHDKNGKEIYEGDIVQTDDYSKGAFFGTNQPVKNIVIEYEQLSTGIGFRILHKESAKVIGNIYENSELL